ncbi:unnamed protein product [Brassica oleracea]|uniref:(rape) hypothetical protein n=1 Tax=Brassica napus TaxID=3708 RepID=A0A816UDM7_BRANA|nr:unnamed protein product [Brassica napus]
MEVHEAEIPYICQVILSHVLFTINLFLTHMCMGLVYRCLLMSFSLSFSSWPIWYRVVKI